MISITNSIKNTLVEKTPIENNMNDEFQENSSVEKDGWSFEKYREIEVPADEYFRSLVVSCLQKVRGRLAKKIPKHAFPPWLDMSQPEARLMWRKMWLWIGELMKKQLRLGM